MRRYKDLLDVIDYDLEVAKLSDRILLRLHLKEYREAIVKLDKIEQIIENFEGNEGGDYFKTIEQINTVLETENKE